MSHRRRYNTSSASFNPPEPGSDGFPAPSNARFPTRFRKLLKGVSPLKVPIVAHGSPESPVPQKKDDGMSEAAIRLAKLKSLPPLSPEGSQFAIDVRQGVFKYADVAGEYLFQLMRGGMPGYEEHAGEAQASSVRYNIGVLCRGDAGEIRGLVMYGPVFETAHKWSADEKSKVSRYPAVICTSGVAAVRATAQHVGAGRSSDSNSPSGVSMTATYSPDSMEMAQHVVYSSGSGRTSPFSLTPSDMSEYEDEEGSTLEAKKLRDMFPHQRYRQL